MWMLLGKLVPLQSPGSSSSSSSSGSSTEGTAELCGRMVPPPAAPTGDAEQTGVIPFTAGHRSTAARRTDALIRRRSASVLLSLRL
ncbi:hypothetical protein VZT92_005713 [Zoarces viviparus]|uniref:Secreted protein n=1 Tax=Zoarces viviparus TaxID=48416 RepID=A0AAW1FTZ4_ZOAVI